MPLISTTKNITTKWPLAPALLSLHTDSCTCISHELLISKFVPPDVNTNQSLSVRTHACNTMAVCIRGNHNRKASGGTIIQAERLFKDM